MISVVDGGVSVQLWKKCSGQGQKEKKNHKRKIVDDPKQWLVFSGCFFNLCIISIAVEWDVTESIWSVKRMGLETIKFN